MKVVVFDDPPDDHSNWFPSKKLSFDAGLLSNDQKIGEAFGIGSFLTEDEVYPQSQPDGWSSKEKILTRLLQLVDGLLHFDHYNGC